MTVNPTATLLLNCGMVLLYPMEEAHLAADKPRNGGCELAAIVRWPGVLGELYARIARRFPSPAVLRSNAAKRVTSSSR